MVETKEKVPMAEPQADQGPGKLFDFADVHFQCGKCGNDTLVAEAMRGISYAVPAAEHTEVKMECTECGNFIRLYFIESSEEAKEARKLEIAAQEAAQKENTPNDGISQEDRKEEPEQGDTPDSERAVETDEQADGDSVSSDAVGSEVGA